MRVSSIAVYRQSSRNCSFKKNNSIEHLSGLDIVNKYEKLRNNNIENTVDKEDLNSILYYSIPALIKKGQYNDAQILYNALSDNVPISNDPCMSYYMGVICQKKGDQQLANNYYNIALNNLSSLDETTSFDVIKNFKSTYLLLNPYDTEKDTMFDDKSNQLLNELNMYLSSLVSNLNNNPQKSANEIKAAYKMMKNNNRTDDDIIIHMASTLAQEGEYEKSNDIIISNLNRLRDDNLVYTKEFIDYLLLLGINIFATSDKKTLNQSTNIFRNVAELANKVGISDAQEIAEYAIAKNLFLENSDEFTEYANNLLNSLKNEESKANLNEMLGDFNVEKEKDKAVKYYKTALSLLENENSDKKQLYELRKKIKMIEPQTNVIDIKSANEDIAFYNTHELINTFSDILKKKDFTKLKSITDKAIQTQTSEVNRSITKIFANFANIELGEDFPKAIKQIDEELDKCKKELKITPDNTDLKGVIEFIYSKEANILYNANEYNKAAYKMNNSFDFLNEATFSKEKLIKKRITAALMNYKAKNYFKAEEHTIKYLELLLDKKFEDTKPLKITQEINKILSSKNEKEKKEIASAYETLGLINLKSRNIKDSQEYFSNAVDIRERLRDKDFELANSYAALARLAIFNSNLFATKRPNSSKELHNKCLEILKTKYPKENATREEEAFHNKYYGVKLASAGKFIRHQFGSLDQELIDKFKCYNKELGICE